MEVLGPEGICLLYKMKTSIYLKGLNVCIVFILTIYLDMDQNHNCAGPIIRMSVPGPNFIIKDLQLMFMEIHR